MPTPRRWRGSSPCCRTWDPETRFIEPCVGQGVLAGHLKRAGHVLIGAYDLPHDAGTKRYNVKDADCFITNPPWRTRPVNLLHPIIINLSNQAPTWLLIYSDWLFTSQATPLLPRLRAVIGIGRLKWIPDSKDIAKDNSIWALFDRPDDRATIRFIGRKTHSSRRRGALKHKT